MWFRGFSAGVVLTATVLLLLPPRAGLAAEQVKAAVDRLNVRSGPGLTYQVKNTLPVSTSLTVLARKGDWVQVKLPGGQVGWVAASLVKPAAAGHAAPAAPKRPASATPPGGKAAPSAPAAKPSRYIQSNVTNLNVRSAPGLQAAVVTTIQPGTSFPLLKKQGQWAQIRLADNRTGWVALWLVREVSAPSAAPAPKPPASGQRPDAPGGKTPGTAPEWETITLTKAEDVYQEASASSPVMGRLSAGDVVTVRSRSDGWAQISYDGHPAWIWTGASPVPSGRPSPTVPDASGTPAAATVTVSASSVNLRSEPQIESQLLATLARGTVLAVITSQGDWFQVRTPDGLTGWVAGWLVQKSDAPAAGRAAVTIREPDTNIRSGPSTSAAVIKRAQAGERYPVVQRAGDWYQIQLDANTTGYVAGWLVDAEGVDDANVVVHGDELRGKVIVVDPGHGGNDTGATGSSYSTLEKNVNLQVALALKRKLESAGATVIMTRTDDHYLTLQDRVDVAIRNKADLFVSIHHNTHPNPATNGTIVFYYDEQKAGRLASTVQRELVKATHYRDLKARFGDYYVLRENRVLAILAEIGFLTNPEEEQQLRSEAQQERAADGIFKGIVRYYQELS